MSDRKEAKCVDCEEVAKIRPGESVCDDCINSEGTKESPYHGHPRNDFKFEEGDRFDDPMPTFVCKRCGAGRFIVGRTGYRTAIKCPECGWERCIHDG